MKLSDILKGVETTSVQGPVDRMIHALRYDSRRVEANDVFFAWKGAKTDGHQYIAEVCDKGAAAVVLENPDYAGHRGPTFIEVKNARRTMADMSAAFYGRPDRDLKLVGVTGTNGTTSCSHWLATALSALGTPCAVVGTLGSGMPGKLVHSGFTTPDAPQLQRTFAQFKTDGAKAVAIEVSSHALHQGRVNGTKFDIAIFTNLTQDHLDYHGTFAAYEGAKAKLFAWPALKAAVINRDDPAGQRLIASCHGRTRTIAYGIENVAGAEVKADALLLASRVRATATGTAFHLSSDWGDADVEVATLGEFNVSNLLGVLGALLAAQIPLDAALAQIAKLEPVSGRMQRLGGRLQNDEPLVVIDYAHTPDALEKTLAALRPIAEARGGQLICMFGCGGDRDATKRPLMGSIAEKNADHVVITSDNPRGEDPLAIIDQVAAGFQDASKARRIEDRASAILQAIRTAAREDVVVLAGKGHEATQEIMGKKRAFSDQDHARLALAARATQARGGGE